MSDTTDPTPVEATYVAPAHSVDAETIEHDKPFTDVMDLMTYVQSYDPQRPSDGSTMLSPRETKVEITKPEHAEPGNELS